MGHNLRRRTPALAHRLTLPIVAVLAMSVAGVSSPAAAAAAAIEPSTDWSTCDTPPDGNAVTPETRDRFIELWLPRFLDEAWVQNFANLNSLPANIRDEGFHDLGDATKAWLSSCLLDAILAKKGETPTQAEVTQYLMGINMVIFGKETIAELREQANRTTPSDPAAEEPVHQDMTSTALDGMENELLSEPSLESSDLPKADANPPATRSSSDFSVPSNPMGPAVTAPQSLPEPSDVVGLPLVPTVLAAVDALLQLVGEIQGRLFTLPVVNLLAPAFYKVCAESPTMQLSCSMSLPVGVWVPTDVTGDNFPDVMVKLAPMTNLTDVGARFGVQRMFIGQNPQPLKAHVFAVYDTPGVAKRVEFGYDGRASTLAHHTSTVFALKNVLKTVTTPGDVQVTANVNSNVPGSTESLTFGVKDLVGGSTGVPPAEENPMAGAVQMSPFPENFDVGAHLKHTNARSDDTFTVASSTPTRVDAVIDQRTTTTPQESSRRVTATVDKLPTSVRVDLTREGDKQTIDYKGSAPIDLVRASTKTINDVSDAGTYTESIYEAKGVPTTLGIDLFKAEDILYEADGNIQEASFQTETHEGGELENRIAAKAHQIPKKVHVTNLSNAAGQKVTYDADTELQDVILEMFDAKSDTTEDDAIDVRATATGIPTHLDFTETKATGAYDLNAPGGIDLIEATLTLGDGALLLPMPGQDHATIYKRDAKVGLDFRLSGFESAHFDGHEDTDVSLGLNPGGQSFDAIADVVDTESDLDVLAKAHVAKLPTKLTANISPSGESATYTGSSVIPLIRASIHKRDTGDKLGVEIEDVPTVVGLAFDGSAATIDYNASDKTGKVAAKAHLTPDSIGGTRTFDAGLTITDIPNHWDATWANGNVLFQAVGAGIGSIEANVTNHGSFTTLGGDHVHAFYNEASGNLDASLKVSKLRKAAFTKLSTGEAGGFEAVLKMGDHGTFSFGADVTLNGGGINRLKALGQFDNLPSDITLRSDGGRITYNGDSNPDLTVAVEAGNAGAIGSTPAPPLVHGVSVRDGASGPNRAVKAKLYLTGLPDHLDLNSAAGIYQVNGYHPTNATLVVDAKLNHLAPKPLTLLVTQGVPTTSPTNFKFGPFTTSTAPNGTHHLNLTYTSNQDLGKLTANATYGGTDEAQLEISEIPKSIVVTGAFNGDTKKVNVTMDHKITELKAAYRHIDAGDDPLKFDASVRLGDVPRIVDLTLGRDTANDGEGKEITAPDFTFKTSDGGLDISAAAAAEIATPADIKAAASLQVTNLAGTGGGPTEVPGTVTGALNGTTLNVTSTPATQKFLLEASGVIKFDVNLGFNEGPFVNTGNLHVNIDVKKLTLGFENASSLQLDLGITTGLKGDYSSFTLGEDTKTVITVEDLLRFVVSTPIGDVNFQLLKVDPTTINFENVIDHFRMSTNELKKIFGLTVLVVPLVGHVTTDFLIRPFPHHSTDGPSFTVGPPPSDGVNPPAWLITPDLNLLGFSLPDFALDAIAYFASPYGNDLKVKVTCHPLHLLSYDCTP